MGAGAVHDAMREVEETRREITGIMRRHEEGWKAQYGRLRPVLDDRIAKLSREGEAWLRGNGAPGQLAEFVGLLAGARSATSHHQAKWPVLVISPDSPDYLASVKTIDDAFARTVEFVNRLPR